MWSVCYVPGCCSKSPDPNITFHRFTNSNKERWCSAIKVPCLLEMGGYCVCSKHFNANQISRYSTRTILDKTAIPSLHIPIAPISLPVPIVVEDDNIPVDNTTPKQDQPYNSSTGSTETGDDSSDSTSSTDTANEASLEVIVKPTASRKFSSTVNVSSIFGTTRSSLNTTSTNATTIKPVTMLKQCRTCTGKFFEKQTKHLDDTIRICNETIAIQKILCASVKIINNSQLPKHICNNCIEKAYASYVFIQMVFKSQKVLFTKYVSKTNDIDVPIIKSNVKLRKNKDISNNDELKNNVTLDQTRRRVINVNNRSKVVNDSENSTKGRTFNKETFNNRNASSLEDRVIFYSSSEDPLREEAKHFFIEESTKIPSDIKKESLNDENATSVQGISNKQMVENSNVNSFIAINNQNNKKIVENDHIYSCLEDPLQEEATLYFKEESTKIPSDESSMIHSIVISNDIKMESLNDENATIELNQGISNKQMVENNQNNKRIIENDHIYSCLEVELKQKVVTEYAYEMTDDSEIPQKTGNSLKNVLVESSLGNELKSISDQVNNCYRCADCPNSFAGKNSYKQHRVAKHRSVSESEDSDEGFLKYQCPHCPTYYYNRISLQSHLVRNHDSRPKKGEATKYQCLTCPKFYCTNSSYLSHIKRKHKFRGLIDGTNKYYKCPYCDEASFKFERSYTSHKMKKHKSLLEAEDDNKRFQCPVCPSFYFHKNSLDEHVMKKHNSYYEKTRYSKIGDKYHCKFCSNSFYNKFNYQCHIRKYHKSRDSIKGGKKYICRHCGQIYLKFGFYQRHLRVFHNDDA